MTYRRLTGSLPVIDIDGALWSVFVTRQGFDAEIAIQVCDGLSRGPDGVHSHQFDGEWHDGDIHLFLDTDAANRLLCLLREAFGKPTADDYANRKHALANTP